MRTMFWSLVLLFAAVALALLAQYNQGSVVLTFPPWRIDVSLNLFAAALFALFLLFYVALRVLALTLDFPGKVQQYRERREREAAFDAFRSALQAYFEGRYGRAEKLARTVRRQAYAGLAALVAARSAHRLQIFNHRDQWLNRASADQSLRTARLITEAELHLEAQDPAAALEAIRQLHSSAARHVHALRLEFLASQQAGLWEEVVRLSRQLDKRKAMHPTVLAKARSHAYVELLQRRAGDAAGLRQLWSTITSTDRAISAVAHAAAQAFTSISEHELAVEIVEQALEHDWQPKLVLLYGQMGLDENVSSQIQSAESWLAHHPQEAALLVTLGKLCMRAGLWGKAADYLQRSQRVEPSSEALLALAQLMEHTGKSELAEKYFRQCALLNHSNVT